MKKAPQSTTTSGYMNHNHGRLYYEVTGSGEPIVFVHGFTLDHRMWAPQVREFSGDYQVITCDLRGFGKSSVPDRPYSHDDDLSALLRHLSVDLARIVGLSMGGRVAVNFALSHPSRMRTLAVLDSALDGYPSEVVWDLYSPDSGIAAAKQKWIHHQLFNGTRGNAEVMAALGDMVADYSGWEWTHKDPQTRPAKSARARLGEISCPTLVVVGEDDLPYFHNMARVIASGIPGAHLETVAGAGHMVNMERPAECNALLEAHLNTSL
ncbi:MAG TPA: alpha/beta fold hydrolase [Candidatus Saccharimonadia bacterium]|nr:alpha/beta fold hydrolase [Candidatus Saccharimonadia bacterium]